MHKQISFLIVSLSFVLTLGNLNNYYKIRKDHFLLNEIANNNITSETLLLKNNLVTIDKKFTKKNIIRDNLSNINKVEDNLLSVALKTKTIDIKPKIKLDSRTSIWEKNFSEKKINFIKTLLPLIEFENQKILLERKKLLDIRFSLQAEKTLSDQNIKYLKNISQKYEVNEKNIHKVDLINELLINVNIIPNSIALAQAINESGWGTSRFAKEYNALFGQYTYDSNNGVIPFEREEGKKHLIKNFSSIEKSVESYFYNINSHHAYKDFRKVRNQIKIEDLKFYIERLTQKLEVYAEDKFYVKTINSIINSNNLNQFDFEVESFIKSST